MSPHVGSRSPFWQLERLLPVYGESLRWAVETESAPYRSQVLGPLLASGLSEPDALRSCREPTITCAEGRPAPSWTRRVNSPKRVLEGE
jgi:hypothetical protein